MRVAVAMTPISSTSRGLGKHSELRHFPLLLLVQNNRLRHSQNTVQTGVSNGEQAGFDENAG